MPRYKLRTLLIVLALGPMVLAVLWFACLKVAEIYWIGPLQPTKKQYIFEPSPPGLLEVHYDPATGERLND